MVMVRGSILLGRDAIAAGLLTRAQLRSSAWRPILRGVYANASLPVTHGLRIAAARLVIPREALIAGRSAAWLYGVDGLVGDTHPVEVLVPFAHRFGPIRGLRIRTAAMIPARDIDDRAGLGATGLARTAWDIACTAPDLVEAVVALDLLSAAGVLRPTHHGRFEESVGERGCAQARRALGLADGRSESPQESRLRVHLVLAGLPAPVPQYVVRHRGVFIARVDLAYPEIKLAIEYDGAWHGAASQLAKDRRRLNALLAAGWRVLHVTAADLHHLGRLLGTVRAMAA